MQGAGRTWLLGQALDLASAAVAEELEPSPRPNIVLILINNLGSTERWTSHLETLAAGGMRFTNFHDNGAVCSPTRAALLTSQYPQPSGVVRRGPWKLVVNAAKTELFNVALDARETVDFAGLQPARLAQLRGELAGWER